MKCLCFKYAILNREKTFGDFNQHIEFGEAIKNFPDMLGRGCRPVRRNKMTLVSNPIDGDTGCEKIFDLK